MKVPPAHWAHLSQIADFAELECLRSTGRDVSVTDVARVLARSGVAQDDTERPSDDDKVRPIVQEAFDDIALRARHCGADSRYPFSLSDSGAVIHLKSMTSDESILYQYLLLATRLNMQLQRIQAKEDGTKLFELLCGEVAKNFFSSRSQAASSLVFGTGRIEKPRDNEAEVKETEFARSVDELCAFMEEGNGFENHSRSTRITAKDGRLDVVVRKPFSDGRSGHFLGMGQCKTGTNWRNSVDSLQPENFVSKWVRTRPAFVPIRMFFVAERVGSEWTDLAMDAGLFFDRCRIIENADFVSSDLRKKIKSWVEAGRKSLLGEDDNRAPLKIVIFS
ncbi:MAG: hypothetical protein GKR94_21070 [Gammaproteobacteria bacterium]|nr:hypothetical protein [Gammaproteobacteria bacterium]